MRAWLVLAMLWMSGSRAAEVTDFDEDDVSQYWAEDLKALGHLYGKTSDKDLYGASLPPPVIFNVDKAQVNRELLKKTGHIGENVSKQIAPSSELPQNYPNTQTINKSKDPQTYNYVKFLELREKQKAEYPHMEGFTPSFGINSDGEGDYSSTQSLFSHDNKEEKGVRDVVAEGSSYYGTNKARSKVRFLKGNGLDSRSSCRQGICRNKSKTSKRFYSRPVKKIKRIIYNYS